MNNTVPSFNVSLKQPSSSNSQFMSVVNNQELAVLGLRPR